MRVSIPVTLNLNRLKTNGLINVAATSLKKKSAVKYSNEWNMALMPHDINIYSPQFIRAIYSVRLGLNKQAAP